MKKVLCLAVIAVMLASTPALASRGRRCRVPEVVHPDQISEPDFKLMTGVEVNLLKPKATFLNRTVELNAYYDVNALNIAKFNQHEAGARLKINLWPNENK